MSILSKFKRKDENNTVDLHDNSYQGTFLLVLVQALIAYIQVIWNLYRDYSWFTPLSLVFLSILLLLFGISTYLILNNRSYMQTVDNNRKQAIEDDKTKYNSTPSIHTSTKSVTISPIQLQLRSNWLYNVQTGFFFFAVVTFTTLLPTTMTVDLALGNLLLFSSSTFWIEKAIYLSIIFIVVIAITFSSNHHIILDINQDGIQKTFGKKVTLIPWDDIQFFATWQNAKGTIRFYEIHNKTNIFMWIHPQPSHTAFSIPHYIPQQPNTQRTFDTYMRLALETIHKRTGLPLHNLDTNVSLPTHLHRQRDDQ